MQIDNIETCTKMVESGLGYAVVPSVSLEEKNSFFQLPILDEEQNIILRDTWLLKQSTEFEYPIVQKFNNFIANMFN